MTHAELKEMRAFARLVADGGTFKKSEIVLFMKAFLDPDLHLQSGEPPLDEKALPALSFEIEKTDTGIHVPREVNRSYSTREGAALVAAIVRALR